MSEPRLVGVYHANGGFKGEMDYIIGKLKGTTHCALCDITHGNNPFGKKEWKQAMCCLPLPMTLVHLNEMDAATRALISTTTSPAIVYIDGTNDKVLVNAQQLQSCHKDPHKLYDLLVQRLQDESLIQDECHQNGCQ